MSDSCKIFETPLFSWNTRFEIRPFALLPTIYPHPNQVFSKYQCWFREGFNVQHCLMTIIEKWRKFLDTGGHTVALITDLSKAFDCFDHELLIVKLNANFDTDSLKLIYSYLRGRKQRTKINCSYRYFAELLLVFLKDQFLCHHYLTLSYVIFFTMLTI